MKIGSLRFQLLSRSLLMLAMVLVVIGLGQYSFMRDIIYTNKASTLLSQVLTLPPSVWEQVTLKVKGEEQGAPRIFLPGASLVFIDKEGNYNLVASGRGENDPPRLTVQEYTRILAESQQRRRGLDYSLVDQGSGEQMVVFQAVGTEEAGQAGLMQISTPTEPLKELLLAQLMAFMLIALATMGIAVFAFSPVLKRTLVPLSNMIDTAGEIDAGNLDTRLPTRQGQMEIDQLAESFNGMLERLEDSFAAEKSVQEKMRRFIADAAHELRTPLTSIHGFLEVLLRGAMNQPEQLEKALKSMHSESQRLNKLVHDLLTLSKLDRTPVERREIGYLDAVLNAMEPQLRILAGNRVLRMEIESALRSNFDSDQIKQVVLNLFHNAVQHTDPERGVIDILARPGEQGVEMVVKDNGPGISPDHLPLVFDRFYRSDAARTRKDGGAGLGLAITKAIVEAHGGRIDVTSEDPAGASFRVWLPRG